MLFLRTKEHTNNLIHEKSPYLLQHAHNPVDWYSWGDEAFDKARTKDKPVFFSIGYIPVTGGKTVTITTTQTMHK